MRFLISWRGHLWNWGPGASCLLSCLFLLFSLKTQRCLWVWNTITNLTVSIYYVQNLFIICKESSDNNSLLGGLRLHHTKGYVQAFCFYWQNHQSPDRNYQCTSIHCMASGGNSCTAPLLERFLVVEMSHLKYPMPVHTQNLEYWMSLSPIDTTRTACVLPACWYSIYMSIKVTV